MGRWWPSYCMHLFRRLKLRSTFRPWEISFGMAAPWFAPVLRSLKWRYLGTGFVVAISLWTGGYSVTRMDAHSEKKLFCFFFPSWPVKFFPFRYRHSTKKNARDKWTWSQEELERSADAWATKFVQTNLRPQLESWLRELDSFFPKELPFGTCRVGRSCFTTMAVTENY